MFHPTIHKAVRLLLATAFFLVVSPGGPAANELSERQAWIGLDLFPSFLAADDDIAGKACDDGMLHLLLVYDGRKNLAEEMAAGLMRIKEIRGIPIRVSIVGISELGDTIDCPAAGIFLAERVSDRLDTVIRFGRDRHAIVFSSFPGDVEKGVTSGMVINDRILPYVNIEALRLSGVRIKSFFLGIAERYGE